MKWIGFGLHLRAEDVEPVASAVSVGDLVVSAVEVPDDQPLSDRDLLLRVASIRAALLERATFIAVRYGFTFRYAAGAEEKLGSGTAKWRRLLEANQGRVEMTLKVPATVPLRTVAPMTERNSARSRIRTPPRRAGPP